MNAIGKVLIKVAEKYPQRMPAILKALNVRMRTKVDDVKLLPGKMSEITSKNPGTRAVVLSVVGGIIGNQALESIISWFESTEGDGVFNPNPISAGELGDLRLSVDAIKELVSKNAGDGNEGTIWGVESEKVARDTETELAAMRLIREVAPIFGGVRAMEQAFYAFHALEPEHFGIYRQHQKVFG